MLPLPWLFNFFVNSIFFQNGVVFLQLQTLWCVFLVLGGNVTAGTSLTSCFVLCALENYLNPVSFLSHFLKLIRLNRCSLSPHFLYNTVESVFVDGTDRFRRKLQRDPSVFLCKEETLGLQVGQKTALGFDIGMRNLVSCYWAFSCNLTYSCHNLKFWEGEITQIFVLGQIFVVG